MSWTSYKLGNLCDIARGGSPRPIDKFITDEEDGINWIKISDATRSKKYIFETKEKIKKEGISRSRVVNDGDFLLSNSMSFGRPYIMRTTGCIHDGWLVLSKYQEHLDIDFFYYLLSSPIVVNQFENLAQGSTVRNLNKELVSRVEVKIPSLSIQKKIVQKLDSIFAEIDKATTAAETNSKNAESLFQSYLTQIFEHGKDGWSQINLKDIAEYFNGLTYSPKNVSDEGVVVLRSSNVQEDKILLNDIVRVNSTIKEKLYVKLGDILMCSRNGSQRLVGKTATIPNLNEKMTFGTFMMIVRSDSNFFIEWFFKSDLFKRQIASGENTMINQITRYMLDKIVIPMPDLATQKSISITISDLYKTSQELKLSYTRKVNELNAYKNSILKQAFNGELVKE